MGNQQDEVPNQQPISPNLVPSDEFLRHFSLVSLVFLLVRPGYFPNSLIIRNIAHISEYPPPPPPRIHLSPGRQRDESTIKLPAIIVLPRVQLFSSIRLARQRNTIGASSLPCDIPQTSSPPYSYYSQLLWSQELSTSNELAHLLSLSLFILRRNNNHACLSNSRFTMSVLPPLYSPAHSNPILF